MVRITVKATMSKIAPASVCEEAAKYVFLDQLCLALAWRRKIPFVKVGDRSDWSERTWKSLTANKYEAKINS